MRSFFTRSKKWRCDDRRSRRSSYRLRLEALEDRCLLNSGYLDPTFGAAGAGVVAQPAGAVLIQSDGKILALNSSTLARYNTNGSLDTSFGSGGTQTTIGGATALQSDGKILLTGSKELERLNSNGSLDTSFGTNGVVSESLAYSQIVVQPNGEIVVAGSSWANGGATDFNLARYNPNGSLDTSFGKLGLVTTTLPLRYVRPEANALLLQANGELVVVGDTNMSAPQEWLLARYNANGSLDTSFGNKGIVATPSAGNVVDSAHVDGAILFPNLATPNDGKIAIVGYNLWLSSGPLLVRFNTNGSLDTTFGSGGFVPLGVNPSGVAFDSSARIVVAGSTGVNNSSDTALERLNSDGTPDTTFGSSGVVTAGLPGTSGGGTLAIYPTTGTDTADSGKIVTGGSHVARFLPSAPASAPSFVVTGPSSTTAGAPLSITVTATDANGNVLTNYTGTVDFATFDQQGVLPANYTFTAADEGVHTFTITLKTASLQDLFVADTATPSMNGRAVGIVVSHGPVTQLLLVDGVDGVPGSSIKSGQDFSLDAVAEDAYGNNLTSFSDTVHFSSSDPNATLPSDQTFGYGSFAPFILRTKGTQTITMTDLNDPSLSVTITIQVT